MIQMA